MSHLDHLRTFVEAYRQRSFSRAAQRLGMTQPAVSLHVQALEALVGKPLFSRQPRGVAPTEAADELARTVGPLLDGLELRLAAYRVGDGAQGGPIHIAGPADFLDQRAADGLDALIDGGFQVRLHLGNRERIYGLLASSAVDLAVTASMPEQRAFDASQLLVERLLIVMAPALTERLGRRVSADRLQRLTLLAFDEDLALVRQAWSARFRTAPTLPAALTVPDLRMLKRLALGGKGWTVLPDYLCAQELARGELVSLTAPKEAATNVLYLVWRRTSMREPHVVRARDLLLQQFA